MVGGPSGGEPWLRRALTEGAIAGVVAPVIVVIIAAAFAGHLQSMFRDPTCDDPKGLTLLTPTHVESSNAEPFTDAEGAYPASNAMDTNSGTAWVEAAENYGVNEWLEFSFAARVDVQMICVVNGYAQSQELYRINGRVRQLEVGTDSGTTVGVLADLPLDEIATFQRLSVVAGRTATVRLTIKSTSSMGGSRAVSDTAISEVEFWGR